MKLTQSQHTVLGAVAGLAVAGLILAGLYYLAAPPVRRIEAVVAAVKADVKGVKATVRSVKKAADAATQAAPAVKKAADAVVQTAPAVQKAAEDTSSVIATGKKIAAPFKATGKFFEKIGRKIGHALACGFDDWPCE